MKLLNILCENKDRIDTVNYLYETQTAATEILDCMIDYFKSTDKHNTIYYLLNSDRTLTISIYNSIPIKHKYKNDPKDQYKFRRSTLNIWLHFKLSESDNVKINANIINKLKNCCKVLDKHYFKQNFESIGGAYYEGDDRIELFQDYSHSKGEWLSKVLNTIDEYFGCKRIAKLLNTYLKQKMIHEITHHLDYIVGALGDNDHIDYYDRPEEYRAFLVMLFVRIKAEIIKYIVTNGISKFNELFQDTPRFLRFIDESIADARYYVDDDQIAQRVKYFRILYKNRKFYNDVIEFSTDYAKKMIDRFVTMTNKSIRGITKV